MAPALIDPHDAACERGEEERALALHNEALTLRRDLGVQEGVVRTLGRLALG